MIKATNDAHMNAFSVRTLTVDIFDIIRKSDVYYLLTFLIKTVFFAVVKKPAVSSTVVFKCLVLHVIFRTLYVCIHVDIHSMYTYMYL